MNSIISLTPQQLRNAADLQERIQSLQKELNALLGSPVQPAAIEAPEAPKTGRRKRRKLSPQAIANIRAGVAKRMAGKVATVAAKPAQKARRKFSPAAKARLSALAKARWAKVKKAGKSRL